ncbi:hypothetical protein ISCGN_005660 [Ixodes scapularis]
MGSDHLPIVIRLKTTTPAKHQAKFIKWDVFRTAIAASKGGHLATRIQRALKVTKTVYQIKEDSPIPDLHLLYLWASRLQALQRYRKNKQNRALRTKLNLATARAKRYTLELKRNRWWAHCSSFGEKTGLKKVWNTYRGMNCKTKSKNTGSNLALRLNITEEELAKAAGESFFPQPAKEPPDTCYAPEPINALIPEDSPFTMGELLDALAKAKSNTAPGPDHITITALRNLPDEEMRELLDKYNEIWESGQLPDDWKISTVIPIPKSGKPNNDIQNLRPISLTSNLCKVMERMVLARITWILESHNRLHPMQTGFRPHLSTQDSLAMIHNDITKFQPTVQPRTIVAIDIKKAFDSIPHETVIRRAKNRGLRGRILNFIKSFLHRRKFQVHIGGTTSSLSQETR